MATFLISMEETDSNFVTGIPEKKNQQKSKRHSKRVTDCIFTSNPRSVTIVVWQDSRYHTLCLTKIEFIG